VTATLGLDPGHDGGSVLQDSAGRPVACWSWRQRKRKGVVIFLVVESSPAPCPPRELGSLAGVGSLLDERVSRWSSGGLHLVVEGLYVDSASRAQAALELARAVGWLTAAVIQRSLSVAQPRARVWRPAILGCPPNASSDLAERIALIRWQARWDGELLDDPHVAEADAMASWGVMQRRQTSLLPATNSKTRGAR
jgi:hypothetical protein